MKETKKKSIMRRLSIRLRVFPVYWKVAFSIILAIGGWTLGSKMFFSADDFMLFGGVVILLIVFWLLANMWLPEDKSEETPEE